MCYIVCKIQECSMTYRQREMYNRAKYLKNLPLQCLIQEESCVYICIYRQEGQGILFLPLLGVSRA